ncbi:hypothetical protein GCM10023192_74450 [Amycolatopsis samaneae]
MDRAASFRQTADRLSEWSVIGYDRRGWGRSRTLGDRRTTLADHVGDLIEIAETVREPILVGHSYGGLVALAAAAARPELTRGVVAFEPPVRWLPWWPDEAPWERVVRESAAEGDPAAVANALHRAVAGRPRLPSGSGRADLAADGTALLTEMLDTTLDEPSFDPLDFDVPLVTAAGAESLPHHHETARRLADLVQAGRFVEVPRGRHVAHVTHPARFAELVGHVEQLSRSAGTRSAQASRPNGENHGST